jgi:C-lobe and N-lobe beta barrels of Tf-binding protein B
MRHLRISCYALLALGASILAGCSGGGTKSPPPVEITGPPASGSPNTSASGSLGTPIGSSTGNGSVDTTQTLALASGGPIGNETYSPDYPTAPPFAIAAPAPATTGANPIASPSLGQPLTGTAFPLEQTAIAVGPLGFVPDTAANSGGATLTIVNWSGSSDGQFRLTIPGLGIDTTFASPTLLKGTATVSTSSFRLAASNMNYAALGAWEVDTSSFDTTYGQTDVVSHLGAFTTGYETPAAAMPTSGTASYSGTNNVSGIFATYYYLGAFYRGKLQGDASFSVNFAKNALTGNFTNMLLSGGVSGAGPTPWNNISVSASITPGTSHFSGTTIANPLTGGGPSAGAGQINGSFYGPHAEELGAVWSLTNGSTTTIGVVAAH